VYLKCWGGWSNGGPTDGNKRYLQMHDGQSGGQLVEHASEATRFQVKALGPDVIRLQKETGELFLNSDPSHGTIYWTLLDIKGTGINWYLQPGWLDVQINAFKFQSMSTGGKRQFKEGGPTANAVESVDRAVYYKTRGQ